MTSAGAGDVSISLAGPLTISSGPWRIGSSSLPGRQGRLVFAYLLLARRPVDRDDLAHLLWPEGLPTSWTGDLSAVVSKLRALLAPVTPDGDRAGRESIVGGRGWYELRRPRRWRVDVEEADLILASDRTDPERLEQVIATARRPFLPGDECAWVDDRRNEQRERLWQGLSCRAVALRVRDDPRAVAAARELVELEPDREDAHLAVVEALLATGDRVGALRAYEQLRRHLRDELGLVPSSRAESLQQQALGAPDDRPPATAVPCPPSLAGTEAVPFVGRVRELDRLLRLAADDDPIRLGVVVGEPGAGKTRLVTEAARRVNAAGGPVLFGHGDGSGEPYGTWVEALSHWLCSPVGHEVMARLLPEAADRLGRLVPGAQLAGGVGGNRPPLDNEIGGERSLLHAAVISLLETAGRTVLVVLDDLHRTDSASLLLLEHLVRSPAPVMVLGTARHPELSQPPTRDVFARLRRDDLVTTIPLAGFPSEEMGALVDAVAGAGTAATRPELVASLHRATAGNPLYVREVARHLALTGHLDEGEVFASVLEIAGLPPGLEELIDGNLARLGAGVRRALEAAATIGTEFDMDILAPVLDQSYETLLGRLELGAVEAAGRHLDILRDVGFDHLPGTSDLPLALTLSSWVAAEVGSPDDARQLLDLLLPYEDLLVLVGTAPAACAGPATHPLALLAARLGERVRAERWFCVTERTDRRLGAVPWLARTELDHARFLAGGDDAERRRARRLAAHASELAGRIGMPQTQRRAEAVLS